MNTGKLSNTGFRSTSGEVISSIERMARQAYDRLDGNVGSLVMDRRTHVADVHQIMWPVASRARPSLRTPLVTMSSAISLHKRRSR